MKRNTLLVGAAAAVLVAAVAIYVYLALGWQRFEGPINALQVNLREPDAYLDTVSLSALPRALVKAPVLRELLTEDFVFYYEDHEERLSLRGAIKRIAFEHDTTLADNLVDLALDEPAEAALWADAKGAPRHWLLAMTRGALARTLQGLAAIAAKDKQLTQIAEVRIGWDKLPVYALTLSSRRTLAIASRGNRVVVLSDPGLLFDADRNADPAAAKVIGELLSGDAESASAWRQHFGLAKPAAGHTLVAGGRLLSFGYQHFFPSMQAASLELSADGAALQTRVRMAAPPRAANKALWSAVPVNPAACAMLTLDGARVRAVLAAPGGSGGASGGTSGGDSAAWAPLADALAGPAAVCWYGGSQLHTPLLLAQARPGGAVDAAQVEAFMRWWLPQEAQIVSPGPQRWEAEVVAPYGPHRGDVGEGEGAEKGGDTGADKGGDKGSDGAMRHYKAALARQGDWWMFSPDDALVEAARGTQERRLPSVADAWPAEGVTLAVASPARIAELIQRESLAVLGPQPSAFRQAAQTQLFPRLAAFGKLPAARAIVSGAPDSEGWLPVQWQAASR